MLRLSLVCLLSVAAATAAVVDSVQDDRSGRFFTVSLSSITITSTSTTQVTKKVFPTCTTTAANLAACARKRSLWSASQYPLRNIPLRMEATASPEAAFPGTPSYKDDVATGELIFPHGFDCVSPDLRSPEENRDPRLFLFKTTTTVTSTETKTTKTDQPTVTIAYTGCLPDDAITTDACT